jgi:hypothetical protein
VPDETNEEQAMNRIAKPAMVVGLAGALALAAITPSEARINRWAAAGIGFFAGAAIASAAAHAHYYGPGYAYGYYEPGYAYYPAPVYAEPVYAGPTYAYPAPVAYVGPSYAYTGDPAYSAYAAVPRYRYRYSSETRSWPPHYDPGAGYNSNTLSPWQDRRLQGADY